MKSSGILPILVASAAFGLAANSARAQFGPPDRAIVASSHTITIGGADLQVDFAEGALDLPSDKILPWVRNAAQAVTTYYGKFPVLKARILVIPVAGRHGIVQGTTWGDMRGMPGFTRIRLGEHTTPEELANDWTMTHELTHMAFPSLPDEQHWMEEGLATYVEPIARVQTGELPAKQIWQDMMDGMPKGEPQPGDLGMDHTHTWGRTYWGGGLFCLAADVEIRKQTKNRKGLQDALRAIVNAGGSIDHEWPLMQALQKGDAATGTTVLEDMYRRWSAAPVPIDLNKLWEELGVRRSSDGVTLDPKAPLAPIRESITQRRP